MIDLTEEQIQLAMRYVVNKMIEEGVQVTRPEQVIRWLILNPLPDNETVAREATEQEEAEKAKRVRLLTEELARLEGN